MGVSCSPPKKTQLWRGWSPHWLSGQYIFEYIGSSIFKQSVPSSQKKRSSEGVDRHVDFPNNMHSNTFALQFPSKAFLPLKKKKKRSSEGVDRHVDFPDNIYSNIFALQFPSKAFLPLKKEKKNAALRGLIATLTFWTIYIWIHSLFNFQAKCSFLSKKKKIAALKGLIAMLTFWTIHIRIHSLFNFQAKRFFLSKKTRSSEGVNRHGDFPDNIYSNHRNA